MGPLAGVLQRRISTPAGTPYDITGGNREAASCCMPRLRHVTRCSSNGAAAAAGGADGTQPGSTLEGPTPLPQREVESRREIGCKPGHSDSLEEELTFWIRRVLRLGPRQQEVIRGQ